ncbi:hypothetical protein L3V82_03965 [Thiotrichales bacterium 19S3-7]|nr:hypothetical protein [Thiotrichales bacterium 19S3-7]MCF6801830.1 hypothetical protein [Thiotrichales bacterium 19S3-11]
MKEIYKFDNNVIVSNRIPIAGRCYGAAIAYTKNIFEGKEATPIREDIANLIQNQYLLSSDKSSDQRNNEIYTCHGLKATETIQRTSFIDILKYLDQKHKNNQYGVYHIRLIHEIEGSHRLVFNIQKNNSTFFDSNIGLFTLENDDNNFTKELGYINKIFNNVYIDPFNNFESIKIEPLQPSSSLLFANHDKKSNTEPTFTS